MTTQQLNEIAFYNFFVAQGLTTIPRTHIYKGTSSPDGGREDSETVIKLPCLIIESDRGQVYATPSRNERALMRIIVRTQRDDENESDHMDRCAEVYNAMAVLDLPQQLSSLDGYTCEFTRLTGSQVEVKTDRHLQTVMEIEVWSVNGSV